MKSFDELLDIIKTLRSEKGCPWDRAQTLESLDKLFLEECYEFSESVHEGDRTDIKEELGDTFFMLLLMGYIAEQQGICAIEDMLHAAREKLIYRHPHVFGEDSSKTESEIIKKWEELKKIEKSDRTSIFDGIPKSLPDLMRFDKLMRKLKNNQQSLEDYLSIKDTPQEKLKNLLLQLSMDHHDIVSMIREINKEIEQKARDKGL